MFQFRCLSGAYPSVRMPISKITKRTVDAAMAPDGKRLFLYDEDLRGFGLAVTPTGSKSYFVEYRAGSGRGAPTRRMTLGTATRITPDEARKLARKTLADVAHGDDPAAKRSRRRKEMTLAELAERYLSEHARLHNKPRTAQEAERLLQHSILPKLGAMKLSDLTRADVSRWHTGMQAAPYAANRALAVLRKMLSLASGPWELREDNPALKIRPFPERKRERFFSDHELSALGAALARAERENGETPWLILATRLLALTGMRLGEVLGLKWAYVDLAHGVIRLPDTAAKAGARTVPLNGPAIALLSASPQWGQRVCAGPGARVAIGRATFNKFWKRILRGTDIEDARPHDLRHTAGTYAAQGGANAFLVRDLLGHKTLAMTGRYVERAADPIRAVAEALGKRVSSAMTGEEAPVLPLRKPATR